MLLGNRIVTLIAQFKVYAVSSADVETDVEIYFERIGLTSMKNMLQLQIHPSMVLHIWPLVIENQ